MFRRIYILFVVYGILACPYNCMGEFSPEAGATAAADHCSCCSRRSASVDSDGDSVPSEQDTGCADCFCEGAVSTNPEGKFQPDLDTGVIYFPAPLSPHVGQALMAPAFLAVGDMPPLRQESGRHVRILFQSFLL